MLKISRKNLFLLVLLAGIFIRIIIASLPGFQADVNTWFAWAIRLKSFDFSHFYSRNFFSDYTPGYLYILSTLGFLKNLLIIPDTIFFFLLKIPAIISELIIGLFIYKEIKKSISEKWAIFTLIFILFNPAEIFNSSIWGQVDSVLTLFMLLAVIAIKRKRLVFSSLFFGIAVLIKPQAIALLPLFVLFIMNPFSPQNLFKLLIPGVLIIFILTFPFFPNQTLITLAQHILNTANEYPYTSVNAYNIWGVVGFWINDSAIWNKFSYQNWGYILLAIYWIIIGYFYFRKKLSIYALATLTTLSFFFLPTRVHERYLYPAIIFLILLTGIYKSKLLAVLTSILSLLHLLNLYYVYIYYNEIYLKLPRVLYNQGLYNFLDSNNKNLSFISIVLFIVITIVIIKQNVKSSEN